MPSLEHPTTGTSLEPVTTLRKLTRTTLLKNRLRPLIYHQLLAMSIRTIYQTLNNTVVIVVTISALRQILRVTRRSKGWATLQNTLQSTRDQLLQVFNPRSLVSSMIEHIVMVKEISKIGIMATTRRESKQILKTEIFLMVRKTLKDTLVLLIRNENSMQEISVPGTLIMMATTEISPAILTMPE